MFGLLLSVRCYIYKETLREGTWYRENWKYNHCGALMGAWRVQEMRSVPRGYRMKESRGGVSLS